MRMSERRYTRLFSLLAYKAESAGREVKVVDPRNTSRTCAECGTVDAASRRAERFACVACGHTDDADINAARNILARAERSGANGGSNQPLSEKRVARHVPDETERAE